MGGRDIAGKVWLMGRRGIAGKVWSMDGREIAGKVWSMGEGHSGEGVVICGRNC